MVNEWRRNANQSIGAVMSSGLKLSELAEERGVDVAVLGVWMFGW